MVIDVTNFEVVENNDGKKAYWFLSLLFYDNGKEDVGQERKLTILSFNVVFFFWK